MEISGSLVHHVLGTLPIATERWPPEQTDGSDGGVDQALEEEDDVGVVGRRVRELQLQVV